MYDVKQTVCKLLEGADVRKTLSEDTDKYALMNDTIEKICNMSASDFVRKYVDTGRKEMVISDLESRFIPFRMEDNEMMELSLDDGRLEYGSTSMGGSREFYFKVKEIEKELQKLVSENKFSTNKLTEDMDVDGMTVGELKSELSAFPDDILILMKGTNTRYVDSINDVRRKRVNNFWGEDYDAAVIIADEQCGSI